MKKVVTKSLEETHSLAAGFLESLQGHKVAGERAIVLALQGDLGAGKTAFVQGLAKALGITEKVTSPTFVLMKRYKIETRDGRRETRFESLIHIDAYRFEEASDMEPLRWGELLARPDSLIALEWPEKIEGALPADAVPVEFRFVDEATREITLPYE